MISMAKSLNIEVVAEGVEEMAQLMLLQDRSCDLGQGFLLSRPVPAKEASRFLLQSPAGRFHGAGRTSPGAHHRVQYPLTSSNHL